MTQQEGVDPRPGAKRMFECPGCKERGRSTQGGPTRHKQRFHGVLFPICLRCAADNAKERIIQTHGALVHVYNLSEGSAQASIGQLLERFPAEVANVYSGKERADRKGDFAKADARAADFLAIARVDDTAARLAVARRAAESAREELGGASPSTRAVLDQLLDLMGYGESQLLLAQEVVEIVRGATPDKPYPLKRERRRAFWGASRRAIDTISGLATAFGKLGRGQASPIATQVAMMERLFGRKAMEVAQAFRSVQSASEEEENAGGEEDDTTGKPDARPDGPGKVEEEPVVAGGAEGPPAEGEVGQEVGGGGDKPDHPALGDPRLTTGRPPPVRTHGRRPEPSPHSGGHNGRGGPIALLRQEAAAADRARRGEE